MDKRTRLLLAALAGFVCVGLILLILLLPKNAPDDLLQRATSVADTSHWFWSGGTGDTGGDTYFWLSDHEILHPNDMHDVPLTFYRYDTRTRRDTPILALDGFIPPAKLESLSPDGKTLAYALTVTTPRQVATAAIDAPLTAARYQKHIIAYDEQRSAWMPDSKHLIEVEPDTGSALIVSDLDGHIVQKTTIPPGVCNRVYGVSPQGQAILGRNLDFRSLPSESGGTPLFESVDPRADPPSIRSYAYSPPVVGENVDSVARLSPSGNRVAWLCQTHGTVHASFLPILDALPPTVNPYPRNKIQIFVGNLDGSDLKEVGQLSQGRDDPNFPMAIQWTTDGQNLSFAYRDKLYVLPVK